MDSNLEFSDMLMVTEHLLGEIVEVLQTGSEPTMTGESLQVLMQARSLLKVYMMSKSRHRDMFLMNQQEGDEHPF